MQEEEFNIFKNIDIKDVALDELIDIRNIEIDESKCVEEKICDFIEQIKNPYIFKVDDIIVKVNFNNDGPTFQEKFQNYLKNYI